MAPPRRRKKPTGTKNKTSMVKKSKDNVSNRNHAHGHGHECCLHRLHPNGNHTSQSSCAMKEVPETGAPVHQSKSEKNKSVQPQYTVTQLMEKVEDFMNTFQLNLAEKFCIRALEMEPNNPEVVAMHGTVLIEMGETETAAKKLKRAIELEPNCVYNRYLSYAQCVQGKESRDSYLKAVSILTKRLDEASSSMSVSSEDSSDDMCNGTESDAASTNSSSCSSTFSVERMKADLSSAYCALAELYMTDLCDEANAEKECLKYIQLAIDVDNRNPEGYQSMASYWLVKNDLDKAKAHMLKSLSLWLEDHKHAMACDGSRSSGSAAGTDNELITMCPLSYSARVAAAKICMELDLWTEGTEVLDGLLAENDEDEETWYLMGYLNYLRGGDFLGNAKFYFSKGVKLMKRKNVDPSDELFMDITTMIAELDANPNVADLDDSSTDCGDVTSAMDDLEIESSGDEEENHQDEEDEDTALEK